MFLCLIPVFTVLLYQSCTCVEKTTEGRNASVNASVSVAVFLVHSSVLSADRNLEQEVFVFIETQKMCISFWNILVQFYDFLNEDIHIHPCVFGAGVLGSVTSVLKRRRWSCALEYLYSLQLVKFQWWQMTVTAIRWLRQLWFWFIVHKLLRVWRQQAQSQ